MSKSLSEILKGSSTDFEKHYNVSRTLGQGSFATVKLAQEIETKEKYAVKVIKRSALKKDDEESLYNEIQILHSNLHTNIVKLHAVYHSSHSINLVMELMSGGELFDRVVEKEHYSEAEAKSAIFQILTAIEFIHSKDIVHRDLKPENLLYSDSSDEASLKLADFGLACILKPTEMLHAACGTPGYVAPEILRERGTSKSGGYGKEVDMWSVGVILYVLLAGFPPFYDDDNAKLFKQIEEAEFEFMSPYWDGISSQATDLISKLLVLDQNERLTATQCLQHPFIIEESSNNQLVHFQSNMKQYNARRRLKGAIRAVQISVKLAIHNNKAGHE